MDKFVQVINSLPAKNTSPIILLLHFRNNITVNNSYMIGAAPWTTIYPNFGQYKIINFEEFTNVTFNCTANSAFYLGADTITFRNGIYGTNGQDIVTINCNSNYTFSFSTYCANVFMACYTSQFKWNILNPVKPNTSFIKFMKIRQ